MPTHREGHLFPAFEFPNGWRVSAQADKTGYQCSPHERLETLQEYQSVEVVIYGPSGHAVDGYAAGLPVQIARKFSLSESNFAGAHVTLEELSLICEVVCKHTQATIPPGSEIPGYDQCKHQIVRSGTMVVISFFGITHTILAIDHVRALREFFYGWEEMRVPENVEMRVSTVDNLFPPVRREGNVVALKTLTGFDVKVSINDVRTVLAAAFASFGNPDGSKFSIGSEGRPQ